MARLPDDGGRSAESGVEVGIGFGERSAHAALVEHHPRLVAAGRAVIDVPLLSLRIGEVVVLVLDEVPAVVAVLVHLVRVRRADDPSVVVGGVVVGGVVVAVVVCPVGGVGDVGVGILAVLLVVGVFGARVIAQPGNLVVVYAGVHHPAHLLDLQLVEDVGVEQVLVGVFAERFVDEVALHRVGGVAVARPVLHVGGVGERQRHHHAQVHVRVGAGQIGVVSGVQRAEDVQGLGIVVVHGVAAGHVVAQRVGVAHEPLQKRRVLVGGSRPGGKRALGGGFRERALEQRQLVLLGQRAGRDVRKPRVQSFLLDLRVVGGKVPHGRPAVGGKRRGGGDDRGHGGRQDHRQRRRRDALRREEKPFRTVFLQYAKT